MSEPRIFRDENEFLNEFYQVMKRHPGWTMEVNKYERIRIVAPEITCPICPIMAIQFDESGEYTGLGAYHGRQIFGEVKSGFRARDVIIDAADFSSQTITSSWNRDESGRTRRLYAHDRLIRMSKEFETPRASGLILS